MVSNICFVPSLLFSHTIVAEIQENSDLTYRLYDYNRVGNDGRTRPLKLDKALQVMNYSATKVEHLPHPEPVRNGAVNLQTTDYFTTNLLTLDCPAQRDYAPLDSFVAFMCVDGQGTIQALDCDSPDSSVRIKKGEAVLIPASLNDIVLTPDGSMQLLEVYV